MRKFVTFSGRAPRAEYWWFILFTTIIAVVLEFVHPGVAAAANLVFVLPTLAVGWRRLHDVNKSGMWNLAVLLGIIPIALGAMIGVQFIVYVGVAVVAVLAIYVLILTVTRGDVGANEFGDDPYGSGSHDPSVFD